MAFWHKQRPQRSLVRCLALWLLHIVCRHHDGAANYVDSYLYAARHWEAKSKPIVGRQATGAVSFSLYLGWITVATIANTASVLNHFGWGGWGIAEPIWSVIMIGAAVIVAGMLLFNRRNLAYAGVLVWALFGIRAAYPTVAVVANTAVIAAILILILALVGYWRTRTTRTVTLPHAQPA